MNKKAPSCIFEWKAAGDNDRSRYWDRKSILLWFLWDLTLKAPQLPRSSVQYGQKVKNRRHYGAAARRTTVAVNLKGVSDKQLAVIHRSIRNTWGTRGTSDLSCVLRLLVLSWPHCSRLILFCPWPRSIRVDSIQQNGWEKFKDFASSLEIKVCEGNANWS